MNKQRVIMLLKNVIAEFQYMEPAIQEQIEIHKEQIEELEKQKEEIIDSKGALLLAMEEINGS